MKRIASILFFVFSLSIFLSGSALATQNEKLTDKEKERIKKIDTLMVEAWKKGGQTEVEKVLAENGIVKVKKSDQASETQDAQVLGDIGIQSAGSQVSKGIECYFDTTAKKYLAQGWFDWSGSYDTQNFPQDAIGIYMDSPSGSNIASYGCQVFNNYRDLTSEVWLEDFESCGVVYAVDDTYTLGSYNCDNGIIWMWLSAPPTASYFKMQYKHTYNTGSVSDIQIGTGGINMTFGTVPANWTVTAPSPKMYNNGWPTN
ncbi:MAG: hypothetical protein ACOY35_00495 [Bacillota bacterium]